MVYGKTDITKVLILYEHCVRYGKYSTHTLICLVQVIRHCRLSTVPEQVKDPFFFFCRCPLKDSRDLNLESFPEVLTISCRTEKVLNECYSFIEKLPSVASLLRLIC